MTKEQRAEALMRQGPIQNVRRIMELEDAAAPIYERLKEVRDRDEAGWLLADEEIDRLGQLFDGMAQS